MREPRPQSREALTMTRSSGVILHPTSLPGGRLGTEAYRFVDWLVRAGQSFWQVLPLGPPDAFGSPYAATSAFAGSTALLADPDAGVSVRAARDFRRRQGHWIDEWLHFTGEEDALAGQVRFEREWSRLRAYANRRGVRIIGDLPLYVERDSADVAARPGLFDTSLAAGVPPDLFSSTGQLWGNPTYRWGALRAQGFRWWVERFRRTLELVDAIRLDHFRGFVAYWAVPYGEPTAVHGRWHRGPGRALFDAVADELGVVPMIAEDLGHITPPVRRLRQQLGAPGMHVLQFGFGGDRRSPGALPNHAEYAVVYTGTHDNAPAAAWWQEASEEERDRLEEACGLAGIDAPTPAWALVELALSSRARLAIVQAQDVLGLGVEARMNIPSTIGGNWQWRLQPGELTLDLARRLRRATARWKRLSGAA